MKPSCFRSIIEIVITLMVMTMLWILGARVGLEGGKGLNIIILPESTVLLQMLYVISEFLVCIIFLMMLGNQILPGGMKELTLAPMTLANKSRYFPGIFALGVFAGLICHAVVIFTVMMLYGPGVLK